MDRRRYSTGSQQQKGRWQEAAIKLGDIQPPAAGDWTTWLKEFNSASNSDPQLPDAVDDLGPC